MPRRTKRGSILSAWVIIGTVLAAGREQRAFAASVGSIRITGGIIQNGDPSYTYQLEADAVDGSVTIDASSTFTLIGLVGVDTNSALNPPNNGAPWSINIDVTGQVTESSGTYNVSDVTWTLASGSISATDGLLALLTVTTDTAYSASLPPGYPQFLTTGVSYSDFIVGSASNSGMNSGSLNLQIGGVPEPSTLTYAMFAVASLAISFFVRVCSTAPWSAL